MNIPRVSCFGQDSTKGYFTLQWSSVLFGSLGQIPFSSGMSFRSMQPLIRTPQFDFESSLTATYWKSKLEANSSWICFVGIFLAEGPDFEKGSEAQTYLASGDKKVSCRLAMAGLVLEICRMTNVELQC